jgi:ABC-type nitrate/sulfonate/bicarbonate transport system substrate-binding protein
MEESMRKHLTLPRRDVLKMGGAGVLGTFIAAATFDVAGAQTPSVEAVKANLRKLRMGDFNPNYATQWTYRLAQALGYFKEVGVDDFTVTLSNQYMPGLIGGSLDITHGDTDVILGAAAKSGLPIKLISIYRDKEWWIMGVRKGINSAADLKGKKITGGPLDGRNTWVMQQVVKELGLDPAKDVTFVPTSGGSDKRLQALLTGTVDAASVFPRHRAALEKAGGKLLYQKPQSAPQEGYAVLGSWLAKNENTAYAYVRADLKARQWLFKKENKAKAYKIMRDLGYSIPPTFEALYDVELAQISPDCGFENAATMDTFTDILKKTGDIPKNLDWRKVVDMKYVWAAQKSLGLPQRPASV